MSYYDSFYEKLPSDSENFPPYLFDMVDLLKKADTEIADMQTTIDTLTGERDDLQGKLETAQRVNLESALKEKREEEAKQEEEKEEVKTISEMLVDVEDGNAEFAF